MTHDMLGRELESGDLVIMPTSRLKPMLLEVIETDVENERPSLVTPETEKLRYVRVQAHKAIVDRHPHSPRVEAPKLTQAAQRPFEVKPGFLLRVSRNE